MLIKGLHGISDWINKFFLLIGGILCVTILVIMFYSVFMRYVMNSSPVWADEACRYCYVWMQMLGAVIACKTFSHTRVSMLSDRLKGRWVDIYKIFCYIIMMAVGALVTYYGWKFMMRTGNRPTSTLGFKMFYIYLAIPVGGVGILYQCFVNFLDLILSGRTMGGEAQ